MNKIELLKQIWDGTKLTISLIVWIVAFIGISVMVCGKAAWYFFKEQKEKGTNV